MIAPLKKQPCGHAGCVAQGTHRAIVVLVAAGAKPESQKNPAKGVYRCANPDHHPTLEEFLTLWGAHTWPGLAERFARRMFAERGIVGIAIRDRSFMAYLDEGQNIEEIPVYVRASESRDERVGTARVTTQ